MLEQSNVLDLSFSEELPATPLHWMIADRSRVMVVEPLKEGLKIYENPAGVLTNSPEFPYHLNHLADLRHLRPESPEERFCDIPCKSYSNGMGAMGLPGDFSSGSRFVKAAFVKCYA